MMLYISMTGQGSTIAICRIHTHAYFFSRMHDFGHAYVNTYAYFLPMIF